MLSEEIAKMERENRQLKELLQRVNESTAKPKQCKNCKYYIQHYGRSADRQYFPVNFGHCICGVQIKKRRTKQMKPEDTCLCFEEGVL